MEEEMMRPMAMPWKKSSAIKSMVNFVVTLRAEKIVAKSRVV